MNKKIILLFSILAFGLWSCTSEKVAPVKEDTEDVAEGSFVSKVTGRTYSYNQVRPRVLKVKFNESYTRRIEASDASVETLCADTKSTLAPFSKYRPVSMHRLFPYAGKYEPRTVASGLDRWYVLEFDKNIDFADAELMFATAAEVEAVEFDMVMRQFSDPFNDPQLPSQWHYYNPGTDVGTEAGSDINVYPVWESYAPGAEDVIVGVVDGGIDVDHPDLEANIWTDPDTGVHGHDFIYGGSTVTASEHGTHVAGTIAAVNNNGVGVCGVAGGDYARGIPGVRLMSCQIFLDDDDDNQGSGAEAIKWSADHGAVISQNSWGYDLDQNGDGYLDDREKQAALSMGMSRDLQDAIDYFIRYAGCDNDGNQLPDSPMKGGVVIFAAGNDNFNWGPPGSAYDPVINVSAIGADYRKASYSNYGSWCDIAAPGGDGTYMILSTLPNGRYGYMIGTSMACPHVSGVAALIVANMGGQGFTNEDLEDLLLGTARSEEIEAVNTQHLGVGLVSAADAVGSGREVHHTVTVDGSSDVKVKLSQTGEITFKISNPIGHAVSASIEPEIPGVSVELSSDNRQAVVKVNGKEVAQGNYSVSHSISGKLVITCAEEPGEKNSADFSATVDPNSAPVVLRQLNGLVVESVGEDVKISLGSYFFDTDGDPLTYSISETSLGEFTISGSQVTFAAKSYGTDEVSVTAKDEFGGEVTVSAPILVRDGKSRTFDVYPNPVKDYLYIRGSEECDVTVEVFSDSGKKVYSGTLESAPFEPAKIDFSSLAGGIYMVKISGDGVSQDSRISKL